MDWNWKIIFYGTALMLAYTQVGYLIITTCLAPFVRRRTPESSGSWQQVTLIIPAHNEEAVLQSKLENALSIDYPQDCLEIIVASDGSSDRTIEIADKFKNDGVRLLDFRQRRGKASILNDAVAAARGNLLCLCDTNVMFHPDALKKMAARLEDPTVGAVSGDVRLASDESNFGDGEALYYRVERAVQAGESRVGSMMGVDGGMYVIRKELFQPLAPETILDDFVTTMNVIRQGFRVVYEPEAIATENGTPTATLEFNRRVRVTSGAMQVLKRGQWPPLNRPVELWQFVSHKLLRWIEPIVLVVLFATNAVLWDSGIVYQVTFVCQILFYFLAAAGTLSVRFRETRIGGISFYFVMSHVAISLGIVKGLLNRQPVTWARTERTPATTETSRTAVSKS